ncbi:MAG: hypothetical protein V3R99_08255 [Thermoguttaceae bacterium]
MSNRTLTARIRDVLVDVRSGTQNAKQAAVVLSGAGQSLEGMPYNLVKERDSIVMDLEIAQWYDDDDCVPNLKSVLDRAERWLREVPLNV